MIWEQSSSGDDDGDDEEEEGEEEGKEEEESGDKEENGAGGGEGNNDIGPKCLERTIEEMRQGYAGPDSWCKVRWTLFHSFFVILIIYSLSDHCMCSILLEESFLNVTDGLRSSLRSNYRTRRQ